MSKPLKTTLSVVAIVVLLGSIVGLILTFSAGGSGESSKPDLQIDVHTREELITSAYKVYGDDQQGNWVAKTIIKNVGSTPVNDFRISYKIEGYCDWTSTQVYPVILPEETVRDYCFPNLDDAKMKELTTKTPVELTVKYEYDGLDSPIEATEKIYLLGKNDFVFTSLAEDDILTFSDQFDNYPLIAAFVTPNEETVKTAANAIASGLMTNSSDNDVYTAFLRCFDTLRLWGVRYIQEPKSYWSDRASQYVQYPAETLNRASGTCLDLAICFSALLEAVGIRSYVALIPGHAIPVIELPESGELIGIESTFVDQEFATSNYPGQTSPEVTATECVDFALAELQEAVAEGDFILIDIEESWEQGVMPIW